MQRELELKEIKELYKEESTFDEDGVLRDSHWFCKRCINAMNRRRPHIPTDNQQPDDDNTDDDSDGDAGDNLRNVGGTRNEQPKSFALVHGLFPGPIPPALAILNATSSTAA